MTIVCVSATAFVLKKMRSKGLNNPNTYLFSTIYIAHDEGHEKDHKMKGMGGRLT
jgi:hypothetical protein